MIPSDVAYEAYLAGFSAGLAEGKSLNPKTWFEDRPEEAMHIFEETLNKQKFTKFAREVFKKQIATAIFKELDQFIINNQLFGEHKISVDTPIVITYFEIKRKYLKPSDKTLSNSFDKKD